MPKWDGDGGRVPTTLFEAAAFQRMIRIECRCGHSAVLQPHALWWHYTRRGLDERLAKIGPHLRCGECKRRGWATVSVTMEQVTSNTLPMPPMPEWKRAVNRFRN